MSYGPARQTYLYEARDDRTVILLAEDCETVKIDGEGLASLDIALKLQADSAARIHVIDESYTFDLILRDYGSVEELARAFAAAGA